MSVQALSWAIEQEDVPARPALVLMSIANHADHTTGYCWLKTETIAREARCKPRSVFRFMGALIRNGYVRKSTKKGADGKQRANDYWILFDRVPAKWDWGAHLDSDDDAPEADDDTTSGEPDDTVSLGPEDEIVAGPPVDKHAVSPGPDDSGVTRKSLDEPSKTNPEKKEGAHSFAAMPRKYHAPPVAPDIQGDLHPDASKPIFVRVGTRAWDAWIKHLKQTTGRDFDDLRTTITIDGERRTGWHRPTLFPPDVETAKESAEAGTGTDPPHKKTA